MPGAVNASAVMIRIRVVGRSSQHRSGALDSHVMLALTFQRSGAHAAATGVIITYTYYSRLFIWWGTEGDWIRRAGVLIAIVGAIVAAPGGAARILTTSRTMASRSWTALQTLRRDRRIRVASHQRTEWNVGAPTTRWQFGRPTARPFNVVDEIQQLWTQLNRVNRELRAELTARIDQETKTLWSDITGLRAGLEAGERRAAVIDARGIRLVVLGVVLTGVPDGLASAGWIGWVIMACALLVTFVTFGRAIIDLRKPAKAGPPVPGNGKPPSSLPAGPGGDTPSDGASARADKSPDYIPAIISGAEAPASEHAPHPAPDQADSPDSEG